MIIASSATTLKWLQMISIRNCGKIIKGDPCPCANRLRKITLKIPISAYDEKITEKQILNEKIKYNNCFHKNNK
jgi:hypothetical protein